MSLILPAPGVLPPQSCRGASMLYALRKLGLTADLDICLDPGDIASWPGSGTKWINLADPTHGFFLGENAGAEANIEPTFTGTPGGLSAGEYWLMTGDGATGDRFNYDSANADFMQAWHKGNATLTFFVWFYLPSMASSQDLLLGTMGSAFGQTGASLNFLPFEGASYLAVLVGNGGGGAFALTKNTYPLPVPYGRWNALGISLDEAAGPGGSYLFVNGAILPFNGAYTNPSSGNATFNCHIGGNVGFFTVPDGSRYGPLAAWSRAMPVGAMQALFQATRRYNA